MHDLPGGPPMPVVMDADRISRALTRIAHEIVERNRGVDDSRSSACAAAACRSRGASRSALQADHRRRGPDRRARHHAVSRRPDAPSGRAAAARPPHRDPVLDRRPQDHPRRRRALHRPDDARGARRADRLRPPARRFSWSSLVDRGHRELPIKADYVGKNVPTSRQRERAGAPAGDRRRPTKSSSQSEE